MVKWQGQWEENRHGAETRQYTPQAKKTNIQRYANMPKWRSTMLLHMRTGKIGLRQHLSASKVRGFDDPNCDRCPLRQQQDVAHILFACPAFDGLRKVFRSHLEDKDTGTTDLRLVLNKYATHATNFLVQTKLIDQFSRVSIDRAWGRERVREAPLSPPNSSQEHTQTGSSSGEDIVCGTTT